MLQLHNTTLLVLVVVILWVVLGWKSVGELLVYGVDSYTQTFTLTYIQHYRLDSRGEEDDG